MLQVKNISVKSLDIDHLDIFWEIGDTYDDPNDYTFIVERSESALGPFDQISDAFSDKYFFRDITINSFHRFRQYWYRIRVTRKSDSEIVYSEAKRKEAKSDLIGDEVRRLETLVVREHIGRICWVFPVRTFGQRCPDWFDKVSRRRLRGNCITCYDTTYARGFLDPIATPVQIDPAPDTTQQGPTGESQQKNTTARLPYFPPLKPRDIIVEAENIRWQVSVVNSTKRLRSVLHQEVQLHKIPESDIEYKLPVNIDDLEKLETSPHREFTNPHHLEAADDAEWWTLTRKGHGYESD